MPAFTFGINLPWFNGIYDHDLGPNPHHPDWGIWYDGETVSKSFRDIKNIGFDVIRIWLMESAEGLILDDAHIITGLDSTFLRNLDDLVNRAYNEGLKLYLCLTDKWMVDCNTPSPLPSPLRDPRQKDAYLERAVKPIARKFKQTETIFAFDIFNEIESEIKAEALANEELMRQEIEHARAFIRRNVEAIKGEDLHRQVSAGSGCHGWAPIQAGHYNDLGLDWLDFHAYNDAGTLPDINTLNIGKPLIVGEFGQCTREENDIIHRDSIRAFLQNATSKGYAGCFLWAYGPEKYETPH